jgi:hypothetical protein
MGEVNGVAGIPGRRKRSAPFRACAKAGGDGCRSFLVTGKNPLLRAKRRRGPVYVQRI